MQDFEIKFWTDFEQLYNMTKKMYIKTEEYDDDFCSIMQPIKEQRDALDHIVRSYSRLIKLEARELTDKQEQENLESIQRNFQKALGHIYRAFYDAADILTIILRKHISDYLAPFTYRQICSCWSDYEHKRRELIEISKNIANLRADKEIKSNPKDQQKIFDEYQRILNFLFDTLDYISGDLYMSLSEKFTPDP